jgi:enoyl-CoA hydratase/carnithine racemase
MQDQTELSDMLEITIDGAIAVLTMNRPSRRNAMCDELLGLIEGFFANPPSQIRAVIITGAGGHYCSGLDLSQKTVQNSEENIQHSRNWHRVMEMIQFGGLPVVSAMCGAVIGGGLELATATHVRIAEPSTIFQLPEGRRGIFVGGGATVRVGRILGADRMTEMMLTGRKYGAEDARALGLAHYLAGTGQGLSKAKELATKIASNPSLSNYLVIQAVSRIDDMSRSDGLFAESMAAALSQTSPDAREGLNAFLEKREPKFGQ